MIRTDSRKYPRTLRIEEGYPSVVCVSLSFFQANKGREGNLSEVTGGRVRAFLVLVISKGQVHSKKKIFAAEFNIWEEKVRHTHAMMMKV